MAKRTVAKTTAEEIRELKSTIRKLNKRIKELETEIAKRDMDEIEVIPEQLHKPA